MEETYHVTFSEDDEAISKSSTEGDKINFNENRFVPDDEFFVPRNKASQCIGNNDYFPYVPAYDPLSTNNFTIPEVDTSLETPLLSEHVDSESIEYLGFAEDQVPAILEPINNADPSPTSNSSLDEVLINLPVPQDRWSREKHIGLVNILGEPQAKIEKKKLIEALEEQGWIIAMQEELNQFKRNKLDKALYGLKQAPRAWYETLSTFLIQHKFVRGFQIKQDFKEISICQEKYVKDLLKKYDLADSALVECPMLPPNNLSPDESGVSVNETLLRGMIGSPMYLTASRLDIQFSTCIFARIALLESKNDSYHLILQFLSKGCIFVALAKQPSPYYLKYLREFWYTTEADITTNSITFTLSNFNKPLSFDLDVFSTIIGLKNSGNFVPLPPKETMKAGLETMGLINENDTTISSTDLVNLSSLKMKCFSSKWRVLMRYIIKWLDIDISKTLFSDLIVQLHHVTGKKERKSNICYTRFLSLVIEHLLGKAYINENLKTFKPHQITASTFKPTFKNEVPLKAHMCNVAELSPEPIKSLIQPSKDVNTDDSADKSLSGTSVQLVTQSKAPTNKKTKRKRILPSSKPKISKVSISASESAEEQGNQLKPANAEKVQEVMVEKAEHTMEEEDPDKGINAGIVSMVNVRLEDVSVNNDDKPFDTESEIKVVKRFQPQLDDEDQIIFLGPVYDDMDIDPNVFTVKIVSSFLIIVQEDDDLEKADSDLVSMPEDDIESVDYFDVVGSETDDTVHSEPKLNLSKNPLGHLRKEISSLTSKVQHLESSITQQVADKLEEFVPDLVAEALKSTLLKLLSESLKNVMPLIVVESVKQTIKKSLECAMFVVLQKELSKVLRTKIGTSIRKKVGKGIEEVHDKLKYCIEKIDKNSIHMTDLVNLIRDMVYLLDSALVFHKANAEGEKWQKGEPKSEFH
ncbi:uncharacterized mitochondrial protein-like protein [Tanacetum coccineum]